VNNQREWWEGFLSDLWLDVQREAKTDEETRTEADFIQNVLRLAPRSKILDVPCGEGRHWIELAARGYQVTGIDITLSLLKEAERKATERQLKITWEHRNMLDLPWMNRGGITHAKGCTCE